MVHNTRGNADGHKTCASASIGAGVGEEGPGLVHDAVASSARWMVFHIIKRTLAEQSGSQLTGWPGGCSPFLGKDRLQVCAQELLFHCRPPKHQDLMGAW